MPLKLCLMSLAFLVLAGCISAKTRAPVSLKELRSKDAVLQAYEYSCGAAALATLMTMFGEDISEGKILKLVFGDQLPVVKSKDGKMELRALTLADLEQAAGLSKFKVVSAGVPAEKNQALKTLHSLKPAITRMKLYQENLHFVVVKDIKGEWVLVSDPGYGNFKIPWSQFYNSWAAGEKILLTISKYPFYAWQDKSGTYLKRNDRENIVLKEEETGPEQLYTSVQKEMALAR